jgi:competence protein ComEC
VAAGAAFVLAAGCAVGGGGRPAELGPPAALAALLLAGLALLRGGPLPLLLAGLLLGWARAPAPATSEPVPARGVVLTGRLCELRLAEDGAWRGKLDRLATRDGRALDRPARELRFTTRQGEPPPGRLEMRGVLRRGPFGARLERATWRPLERASIPPLARLRSAVRHRLEQRLASAEAGFAIALLLGERDAIPEARYGPYRDLGLLHLLAVSGMHLWLWDGLLRRLLGRRGRAVRLVLLAAAALLAGGRPPVVRALAFVGLRELAARRGWQLSGGSLWFAALATELGVLPPRPADLGLILSYAATGALLLVARRKGGSPLTRTLRVSLAATCATSPWLHAVQGTVEPWSVLLTPLLGLVLPVRLLLAALVLFPGAGPAAAALLGWLGAAEGALLEAASRLPASPLLLPEASSTLLGAACAAVLLVLSVEGRRARRAAGGAAAALAAAAGVAHPVPDAAVAALPVGHGLSVVVASAGGTLVFDLGSAEISPRRLVDRVLLPQLHRRRWPTPQQHLASHDDLDHVSGLARLAAVTGSRRVHTGAGSRQLLEGLGPWRAVAHGSRPADEEDANGRGQILELRGPPGRVVLMGDQDGWSLRDLLGRLEPGPVELLVLPHHGLSTDGLPELLDHLQPAEVWASCGTGDLPLPAAPIVARRGIPLRTTLRGALDWPRRP